MSTWNHRVRLATDQEGELHTRHGWPCAVSRKCAEPITHFVGYNLITGRSGRTGEREIGACTHHATQFATKHGLTIPEPTAEAERADAEGGR